MSTVPLQPLYLLNNDWSVRRARSFARRVLARAGTDPERQTEAAFVLALGRRPDAEEVQAARAFFREHAGAAVPEELATTLVHFCQGLLNVNEFVYLE